MGLFDFLLGGSESSSTSTQSSQAQSFVNPLQQQFLTPFWGEAFQNLVNAPGGAPGQAFASNLANMQLDFLNRAAGPEAAQGQIDALGTVLQDQFSLGLNQIQNRFGQGNVGPRRAAATSEQLFSALASPFAQGVANIYGNTQQAQLQSAALAPSIFGTQFAPLTTFADLIGSPTVLGQSQSSGTSTASGSSQNGLLESISLGFMMSDRRLKTGIQRIGTRRGVPWYRFHYIDGSGPHIGVMADEVAHIPGAVAAGPGGFLMVDYGRL